MLVVSSVISILHPYLGEEFVILYEVNYDYNAWTNDHHAMAVCHIGNAVLEFTCLNFC